MKYLFFAFFYLLANTADAQTNLISKDNGKYIYNLNIYKCKELGEPLAKSEKASQMYNSGRNYYNAAKYLLVGGLAIGTTGVIKIGSSDDFFNSTGVFMILIGTISVLSGIIPRIVGDNKIETAVEIFNFEMLEKHGFDSDTSLLFGETQNGIGFVLQF